ASVRRKSAQPHRPGKGRGWISSRESGQSDARSSRVQTLHSLGRAGAVAAMGRPEFITGDMVKDGAVVVDVGMNRVEDSSLPKGYRLCGDVDFVSVSAKASAITPVPGGVGPMTIAMLLTNTVWSAESKAGISSPADPF